MESPHERAIRDIEEVELLAEVAGRYSVPLVALGPGTASKADVEGQSIMIQFDLMRGLRLGSVQPHGYGAINAPDKRR